MEERGEGDEVEKRKRVEETGGGIKEQKGIKHERR